MKPANVFVGDEGGRPHAYLGDFGLSKGTASVSGLTRTGFFVGTIDYARAGAGPGRAGGHPSRRLRASERSCSRRSPARFPFLGNATVDKISAHISEPAPRPSRLVTLPAAFDAVVARAMAKAPAERYATAGELGREALAAAEARRPGAALARGPARRSAGGSGRADGGLTLSCVRTRFGSRSSAARARAAAGLAEARELIERDHPDGPDVRGDERDRRAAGRPRRCRGCRA